MNGLHLVNTKDNCLRLTHENLYSQKNNRYRKKSAALPAAALPFARGTSRSALVASAAADRNRNRAAQNFYEILLAIGQSGSAALPLPRVPPFYILYACFRVYIFHA